MLCGFIMLIHASEKETYLYVQSLYLSIIYLLLFHNILLYKNVNQQRSSFIFGEVTCSVFIMLNLYLNLYSYIKQLFVQLCCCFGDMIRMFYIIDRHLKCIVYLKNRRHLPCKAYKLFNLLKICQICSVLVIKEQKQNET